MINSIRGSTILLGALKLATLCNASFNWSETKYVIAFGDSYSFVQGTAGYPRYSFIGSMLDGEFEFSASELLDDRIVQNFTGTAEGGPNWLEYLTNCAVEDGEYAPADCPVQLWDFAFAGGFISSEFIWGGRDYTIPLVNQTQQYLAYADPVLAEAPVSMDRSKALVSIWIGINDVLDSKYRKPLLESYESFWTRELDALFAQSVTAMLAAGYQNFLFLNLPPLDRTPENQQTKHKYPNKNGVDTWSKLLSERIDSFQQENDGVQAMLYDTNAFLNEVMDDPASYGITNTSTYCTGYNQPDVITNPEKYDCAPLNEYFWYNSLHMTSHTHKLMATDLAEFLEIQSA
ncbi:hypothetical protein E8E14_003341 [Neopestalotiopsis sp. 37M]|nr:hypothetical protein E8E14_003341 [Neopestalotiopsis sp. 37M]